MLTDEKLTTWKIRKDTASELIKIKGELQAKRGQTVNQDDVMQELVRCWREKKWKILTENSVVYTAVKQPCIKY